MNILLEDRNIRNAVHWIDWETRNQTVNDPEELIQKACERFGLTLMEVQYLFLLYNVSKKPPQRYPWTDFGL